MIIEGMYEFSMFHILEFFHMQAIIMKTLASKTLWL